MLTDIEIALKYKPNIRVDINEPFKITGIGYTIFRESKQSLSFPKRSIVIDEKKVDFVIEYSIWYDYDIQHLYDLEHLWIYVGFDGSVVDAEGSFHGKYLKMIDPETGKVILEDSVHLVVFSQPGKHAFLPMGNLIRLVPNWYEACNTLAGSDGVLVQDMFSDKIHTNKELQLKVEEYIKIKFGFEPSLKFKQIGCEDGLFMSYEELFLSIPDRVNTQIRKIEEFYGNEDSN